jgi:ACS family hexuronate transporter-like MFS transporter
VSPSQDVSRFRWIALAVFVLSTAINYLDRQTLATLAPAICAEFHLSDTQYGFILSAFSVTYAVSAPLAGMLIDRVGLNLGIGLAVGLWSSAGIATGFTRGLGGLVGCRAALGVAEAGGIPGAGKAIHQYLKPGERALGNALNQAGVSLGAALAMVAAPWLWIRFGWRSAFVATGLLGLMWIPVWNWTARRGTVAPPPRTPPGASAGMLRDRRLWAFIVANALAMTGYSLWTNWTTKYLVQQRHVTLLQQSRYAWIPVAALLGGFAGGALSLRFIARGVAAPAARFRACLVAAALSLVAAAIPAAPTAAWAAAGIAVSYAAVSAFSVNMYSLPLDVFGGARAAFAVSMLVASYGATQALVSPAFGRVVELYGYAPLMYVAAATPLAACAVLRRFVR